MISPRAVRRGISLPPLPHVAGPRRLLAPVRRGRTRSRGHFLWLVMWMPFWLGNEMPPPGPPRERQPEMVDPPEGTAGAWLLDQLDDLRFRFGLTWAVALALRGAWMGGLIGICWIVLAQVGVVSMPDVAGMVPLVAGGAALGLILRVFHRPGYLHVALMLDTTFGLRSRIGTAVLGLRASQDIREGLHPLQMADAANAMHRARGLISKEQWLPVREIFMGCIVAVILLFLMVAQQPEDELPPLSETGIPGFVPVSERLAEAQQQAIEPPTVPDVSSVQDVADISRQSNQARQDLDTIGDALQGNSVTGPASDSIGEGNYSKANEQLDQASGDVARMPASDRERLADQLEDAADDVADTNPELADSARSAANDVRSGEDSGALDALGDEVESVGSSVESQDGSSARVSDAPSEPSSSTGQSSSGSGAQPESPQPPGGDQDSQGGEGASQGGDPGAGMSASGGVGEAGEDDAGNQGTGSQSEGGQGSGQSSNEPAQNPADAASEGGGSSGQSAEGDASAGEGGSLTGRPNEEGVSSQGSGAGSGQRNANDPNQPSDSTGGGDIDNEQQAPESGEGEAADNPPPGGSGNQDEPSEPPSLPQTDTSINLPGSSDERVRSGSDIGASSVGSGGGASAAAGNASGSASGSAGPNSNDVPAAWRQIVEGYFHEGGSP